MYQNHNNLLIFSMKIQIHNFVIFLKIKFLDTIWDSFLQCVHKNKFFCGVEISENPILCLYCKLEKTIE